MSDILKDIMSYVPNSLVQGVASKLGESESGVTKAIGAMVPTVLAGLMNKSDDSSAMSGLFSMLTDQRSSGLLDGLGSLVSSGNFMQPPASNDLVSSFVGSLFGNKTSSIASAISSFSGVKQSSSNSLMSVVGSLVMGFLSKKIMNGGLNLSSLTSLFAREKSGIMAALPSGVGGLLGMGNASTSSNTNSGGSKIPLILGAIAALLLALFLWKSCNTPELPKVEMPVVNVDTVAQKVETVVDNTANAITGFFRKLSSGFELKGDSAGIERSLVEFVESTAPVDKETWFNFDRLVFQTGSADLDMERSKDQLTNIHEILKAYPNTSLKIGGYTDNTGNAGANVKLSTARAETVKAALVAMGTDAKRLETEGYGSKHPVCPANDTEACKAQNRRIAVRVMAK